MVGRVWRSSKERSCGPDVQVTSPTDQPWPAAMLRPTARPASPRSLRRFSASCNATAIFPKTYLRLRSTLPRPKNGATMTTTTAVPPESRILNEGYGPGAWHGRARALRSHTRDHVSCDLSRRSGAADQAAAGSLADSPGDLDDRIPCPGRLLLAKRLLD